MLQENLTCFQGEFWQRYSVGGVEFPGLYIQEYSLLESGDATYETFKPAIFGYVSQVPAGISEGDIITRVSDRETFTVSYTPAKNSIGRIMIPVEI